MEARKHHIEIHVFRQRSKNLNKTARTGLKIIQRERNLILLCFIFLFSRRTRTDNKGKHERHKQKRALAPSGELLQEFKLPENGRKERDLDFGPQCYKFYSLRTRKKGSLAFSIVRQK